MAQESDLGDYSAHFSLQPTSMICLTDLPGTGLSEHSASLLLPTASCRHRCSEPHGKGVPGCQCDSSCKERQDCCWDYEDTCVEPTRSWKCTNFRCGETRIPGSYCSCSDDCLQKKDCCVNYYSICKGETSWVEEPCMSIETSQCPAGFPHPPLILFSMDGFRAEYLETWSSLLPNIEKLKMCGTHSKYMRAVYPTKTFPNHYTIVTGLYPESHGIIDNNMYDVGLNAHFSLSGEEKFKPAWWKGQPVWLTAMYQNLTAGTFFWPGSDVPIEGTYPTLYTIYNGSIPYEERISGILKWLDNDQPKRPDIYTLYIEEPDSSGHSFGPVSAGVIKALQAADQALGMLMDGLKQRNLHKCVNLIVLADHGMEKTYCEQLEYMTNYFKEVDFYMYAGPAARIRAQNVPDNYYTFDSEGIVKNLTCRRSPQHFKPYLTPDLPKRFHYANNVRIDKVHLLVDRQWLAVRDESYTFCGGGDHGYNNEFKSMEAIFLAYGPNFKEKTEVDAFENIEVYNLMCGIGSEPHKNFGNKHTDFNGLGENLSAVRLCDITLVPYPASSSHLPYGRPKVLQKENVYCLLSHHQYVSGYSSDIWMPLWTAYTVNKPENTSPLPPTVSDCLRADVRIPAAWSQNCSDYPEGLTLTHSFLYPPNYNSSVLEQYDALLTSNIVPMYKAFKEIWDYFHDVLLQKYARERNGVNVISGPVFDYNYDGHFDIRSQILYDSHCNTSYTPLNCSGSLDALSFIIPHRPDNTESCAENKMPSEWVEERVQAHAARVRDVELLTGLDFYQERNESVSEILRLKTFLPIFEIESN
uniref:Ectonucleotide pyrophosphatase/phosphodiesterase 3 n=1 Tax=Ficedula albicollis TaxID=59894 RepID=A0A803VB00_FICAL